MTTAPAAVHPPGHRKLDRARFGEVRDFIHHHGGIATGSNAAGPSSVASTERDRSSESETRPTGLARVI
jgi:hypothetical protein